MPTQNPLRSSRNKPLEWLYFFIADVQTGLGPFLAAYLSASGWNPGYVGYALTFQGLITVVFQTPAGAVIDSSRHKRLLIFVNLMVLAIGALLLAARPSSAAVFSSAFLIGLAGAFLSPTLAAITLGLVGGDKFDAQFSRNQGFNAAGNVFCALLIGFIGYRFGYRTVFLVAAAFTVPSLLALARIDPARIDYASARGATTDHKQLPPEAIKDLLRDRVLLYFFATVFLFHLSNAAMLPQLGELLAKGNPKAAAPFMSACIMVTQLVIAGTAPWVGKQAHSKGRRTLLLLSFAILPLRGMLYTLTKIPALLIGIQVLDGIANCIFVVVAVLVVRDRTEGTGRFNLASGAMATVHGIGAALSASLGGFLIQRAGFTLSFAGLAVVGTLAALLLWWKIPETRKHSPTGTAIALEPISQSELSPEKASE